MLIILEGLEIEIGVREINPVQDMTIQIVGKKNVSLTMIFL